MLDDLNELQAMVAATLEFGRDIAVEEPARPVDLVALMRTVLDDAADARLADEAVLTYAGPQRLVVPARPLAMKRALANLVTNAVLYGGCARVEISPPAGGMVTLTVDDNGPGVPEEALEQVFQPFHRVEESRNRETGGVGLGLPIARNMLRAHGGEVTLSNRRDAAGRVLGARATVTMPA